MQLGVRQGFMAGRGQSRRSSGLSVREREQAAQLLVVALGHVQWGFAPGEEVDGDHGAKLSVLLLPDKRDVVEVEVRAAEFDVVHSSKG